MRDAHAGRGWALCCCAACYGRSWVLSVGVDAAVALLFMEGNVDHPEREAFRERRPSIAAFDGWRGRLAADGPQGGEHPLRQSTTAKGFVARSTRNVQRGESREATVPAPLAGPPSLAAFGDWRSRLKPTDNNSEGIDREKKPQPAPENLSEVHHSVEAVPKAPTEESTVGIVLWDLYRTFGGTMPLWRSFLERRLENAGKRCTPSANDSGSSRCQAALRWLAWLVWGVLWVVDANLRGMGQVMFLNSSVTGLFVLAAALMFDVWMTVCMCVATFSGTMFAVALQFNHGAIGSGLFSFNGTLVGLALAVFTEERWSWLTIVFCVIFGAFSSLLQLSIGNVLIPKWGVPPFTISFNIAICTAVLCCYSFGGISLHESIRPGKIVERDEFARITLKTFLLGAIRSVPQVYFISSWASSIVMLVGIACCSPISLLFSVTGAAIGTGIGCIFGADPLEIESGLWGYNSVLACMAIGGMFYELSPKSSIVAALCGVVAAFLFGAIKVLFIPWGLPAFTFPFTLGTWVFVFMQGSVGGVVPVDLLHITTPEGALRRKMLREQRQRDAACQV